MFKIATFNVNSVNARMPILGPWLEKENIDVVAMQEIKCQDEKFPLEAFEEIGYHAAVRGQKSYNGVAILSRKPFEEVVKPQVDFCQESEARIILAKVDGLWIVNTYIPQGRDLDNEQFPYKLNFLESMGKYLVEEGYAGQKMIWLGDLNVAMDDRDVHDPDRLRGRVCFNPEEQKRLAEATKDYVDIFRKHIPDDNVFTFWDYRVKNGVQRNIGWRIDHIFATTDVAEYSKQVWIDKSIRMMERPSDHTALIAEFDF